MNIELKNISFAYNLETDFALKDIFLSLKEGTFNVLVGRSGCGKSTLLRALAGTLDPQIGEIIAPQNISVVFQDGALLPWLTVYENLEVIGAGHRAIEEELSKMKILDFENIYPRNLSGGQKQRVGIARALVVKPKLLLLDEPFSALDTDTTRSLHQELLSIWKKSGMTILMVSHSVEEALLLADKIIVMKAGKIKEELPLSLPRPRSEEDPNFLGFARRIKKMI